jgi:hypothetical protein
VSRGRPCDYSGMTYELILKMGAVRWPCNEQHPHGTERLYEDLKFWTGIDECESYSADFQKAQPPRKRLRWMISVRLGNVSRMIGIISHESSAAAASGRLAVRRKIAVAMASANDEQAHTQVELDAGRCAVNGFRSQSAHRQHRIWDRELGAERCRERSNEEWRLTTWTNQQPAPVLRDSPLRDP